MTELEEDEQFYRDTESIAFPKLDDRQLAMLEPLGTRRILRRGEMLFKAGQRDLGLTVILRGGECGVGDPLRRSGQDHVALRRRRTSMFLAHTEIRKMTGGKVLEAVELENTKTHERRTGKTSAVFSMIGAKPCTAWLPPEIECDEKGFIKTGQAVAGAPAWKAMGR